MINEVIHKAVDLLKDQTGCKVRFHDKCGDANDFDGYLELINNQQTYKWVVQFKNELTANYLLRLKDLANNIKKGRQLIIITGYANPGIRKQLRKMEIDFLDAAGNAFMRQDIVFIKIDGHQRLAEPEKLKNRAFTNAGLKVLFYFLYDPVNVNKTIREIAADTDTALDTVHKTMNALIQMKHILKVNEKEYRLIHAKELLDRWIQDYELKLKTRIFIGTFRFARKEDELQWKNIKLDKEETFWGGETAGAILTNYLNPEFLTLYTTCTKNELAEKYKLLPDAKGIVMVYNKFWKFKHTENNTVPAILAYTDLITTGDDRCIETAKIIYNELLAVKYH